MASDPQIWWDLDDFLAQRDQAQTEQHESDAGGDPWDGLRVVSIDEVLAGDGEI